MTDNRVKDSLGRFVTVATESERFWAQVDKTDHCWHWTGALIPSGYGSFMIKRHGKWIKTLAHRWAYEHMVGPIPDGLQMDHLCRVRNCVRPNHLEPVTNRVNSLRGNNPTAIAWRTDTCLRGHSLLDAAIHRGTGRRECRTCKRMRSKESHRRCRARKKAAAQP